MTAEALPDLIDRLGAAAVECRQLLADMHTMSKTLRADVKAAQEERRKLGEAVKAAVSEELNEHIASGIEEWKVVSTAAIERSEQKIAERFDTIMAIMLGEHSSSGMTLLEIASHMAEVKRVREVGVADPLPRGIVR